MKAFLSAAFLGLLFCTGCASTKTVAQPVDVHNTPVDVTIDHLAGTISPAGLIRKRPGDIVHVQIVRTDLSCFTFNVKTALTPPGVTTQSVTEPSDVVDFGVRYDGDPLTITISAVKLTGATCSLVERKTGGDLGPWEINVANDGWDLAFAGAFTADNLTDPTYTIEQSSAATSAGDPAKYKIFKTKGDQVRLGSAAMVHLYHTEPDPNGKGGVNWVPFSFGLGVGDTAHVRYYLGTGARFDKKLFLNAGVVLGSQKTLSNIPADRTTTEANFLTSHGGSRTAAKFFFSVSYSFIGVGPDNFKGAFTSVAPAPAPPAQPPADPDVNADVTKAGASDSFTYKLEVSNGGGNADNVTIDSTFPATVAKASWKVKATGGAQCGSDQTDQAKFHIASVSLPKGGGCEYDVTLDKPAAFTAPTDVTTTVTDKDGTVIFPAQ